MKNVFQTLWVSILWLSISSIVNAAELTLETKISKVTVFPQSAKVSRVGEISLPKGKHVIRLSGLPMNLDESSLNVSGESIGEVELGSVELSRDYSTHVIQEKELVLKEKIEVLNDEKAVIQDDLKRYQLQLNYIKTMALGQEIKFPKNTPITVHKNETSAYRELPLNDWSAAWKTLEEATQATQKQIRDAKKLLSENQKTLAKLNRELRDIAVNQTATKTAVIAVESDSKTTLTLGLRYLVYGASWAPIYDADLNTETSQLTLKTIAQVNQRTGEDWKNVELSFSTLRPLASSQVPELNPWVIDFRSRIANYSSKVFQQKEMRIQNESVVDSAAVLQDQALGETVSTSAPMRKVRKMKPKKSNANMTNFSVSFDVPGKVTLASGSNKRRFALSEEDLVSNVKLASAPRFDPRALIESEVVYSKNIPLLAGAMNLYRDGNYVGKTHVKQKLTGETLSLGFGSDDKVSVNFQPDPELKKKDGLIFGKRKVIEKRYKLTITNRHTRPYDITIYDVLPTAGDDDIKISQLGDKPDTVDIDDKKGVVSWQRILQPNIENDINYGYSISYPEKKTLSGI